MHSNLLNTSEHFCPVRVSFPAEKKLICLSFSEFIATQKNRTLTAIMQHFTV